MTHEIGKYWNYYRLSSQYIESEGREQLGVGVQRGLWVKVLFFN